MDLAVQTMCVYQCSECRNIVADSTCALKFEVNEESVVFSNVSGFVVEEKKMLLSSFGNDAGCVYISVNCRCGSVLGRKYISTVPHLDTVRNRFCLFQENLHRYMLGSRNEDSSPENSTWEVPEDGYLVKCALVKFNSIVCKLVDLLKNKGIIENGELEDLDFSSSGSPLIPAKEAEPEDDTEHTDSGRSSLQGY